MVEKIAAIKVHKIFVDGFDVPSDLYLYNGPDKNNLI